MNTELLPWHSPLWNSLEARRAAGTLPHGLLLCGVRGVGKRVFAERFAAALQCTATEHMERPCGTCHACRLVATGAHPDLKRVTPEEDSKVIKIDQIRALCAQLAMTSQYGGWQVALIDPADAMNTAAANSLLKTLEEPTANTILLLVTDRPASLPATIRSRCQRVQFTAPPAAQAHDWLRTQISGQDIDTLLALGEGAPLRALALGQGDALQRRAGLFGQFVQVARAAADPLAVAAAWLKANLREILDWLRTWVMDMIRLKAAGKEHLVNRDLGRELQGLADGLDLAVLYGHLDRLTRAARLAETSVNTQLLLEDILIPWAPQRQAR